MRTLFSWDVWGTAIGLGTASTVSHFTAQTGLSSEDSGQRRLSVSLSLTLDDAVLLWLCGGVVWDVWVCIWVVRFLGSWDGR